LIDLLILNTFLTTRRRRILVTIMPSSFSLSLSLSLSLSPPPPQGELPMHIAAQEKACSSKVVDLVLHLHPDAAMIEVTGIDPRLSREDREEPLTLLMGDYSLKRGAEEYIPGKDSKKTLAVSDSPGPVSLSASPEPCGVGGTGGSQRNKTTPLALAITHGATNMAIETIARVTERHLHKAADPQSGVDYAREYFEMNYPRHYSGHLSAKRAFKLPEVPDVALPTPLTLQRQKVNNLLVFSVSIFLALLKTYYFKSERLVHFY
jgi:hypothetical protein